MQDDGQTFIGVVPEEPKGTFLGVEEDPGVGGIEDLHIVLNGSKPRGGKSEEFERVGAKEKSVEVETV